MNSFKKLFQLISEGYKDHIKIIKRSNWPDNFKIKLIQQLNKHRQLRNLKRLPNEFLQ